MKTASSKKTKKAIKAFLRVVYPGFCIFCLLSSGRAVSLEGNMTRILWNSLKTCFGLVGFGYLVGSGIFLFKAVGCKNIQADKDDGGRRVDEGV